MNEELKDFHIKQFKDSNLYLIHRDRNNFNIAVAEEKYKATYVGEFCLKSSSGEWINQPFSIFYNPIKHPEGSNYFALYYKLETIYDVDAVDIISTPYITNGISAVIDEDSNEPVVYTGVVEDSKVLYSAYRHDFQTYKDLMMDGGRDYSRYSCDTTIQFTIVDGEVVLVW